MTENNDDKIKNVFTSEFQNLIFDVYSENGQINENNVMYTVFVDKSVIEKFSQEEHTSIMQFAKSNVFDEIFLSEKDDYTLIFFGLIIQEHHE